MTRLAKSFSFELHPVKPFSFSLTVKKPAGWSLFNPSEIYKEGTLWTATHMYGKLLGIRLSSKGTVEDPLIRVCVFSEKTISNDNRKRIIELLGKTLGVRQNLSEFYRIAKKDNILKHVIGDLYGMHDTFSPTLFSEAVLAILLQMAPLKRSNEMMSAFIEKYGDTAEFDDQRMKTWPTQKKISKLNYEELSKNCKVGYRAKNIVKLAKFLNENDFPTAEELEEMTSENAKKFLIELPGIGDYSADIINPNGGFPIDVWSAEVFGKLFFGKKPTNNRKAVEKVKTEGLRRWGEWSWMAFFYTVQDLENLSRKMGKKLRLT